MYLIKLINTSGAWYLDLHGQPVGRDLAEVFATKADAETVAATIRNQGRFRGYHVEVEQVVNV